MFLCSHLATRAPCRSCLGPGQLGTCQRPQLGVALECFLGTCGGLGRVDPSEIFFSSCFLLQQGY